MSREVLYDYDDGHGWTEAQRETLGVVAADPEDGWHVYGQLWENGTYRTGMVLRHAANADLLSDTAGEVSETIAAGSTELVTNGSFSANLKLKGALGYVYDGAGEGQTFWITDDLKDNVNKVSISLLAAPTVRPRTTGWAVALDTTSRFRLWFPGRFYFSDGASTDLTAGVIQTELTVTDAYKPYLYLKCGGGAFARQDVSHADTPFAQNEGVLPLAGGLVTGVGTLAAANLRDRIGWATMATTDTAADSLFEVYLDNIRQIRPSKSRPNEGHSGNTVNII